MKPQTASATAELACLDGTIGPAAEAMVPATDEGLLRGDGVFEVIRVYDVPRAELEREAPELLDARGGAALEGALRIVLTRGGRRLLLTEALPEGPERPRLGFVTYAPTRVLDGIKSLSYAANMLTTRLAKERGFDEALLVTPHGRVLEAPTSSVFWVADGTLRTPPLDDHILASITRDRVMRALEVEQASAEQATLLEADEVFLASTLREVQSVAAVEEREFPQAGPRTEEAAAVLRAQIEAEL